MKKMVTAVARLGVVATLLTVAACGVRGDPEVPPPKKSEEREQSSTDQTDPRLSARIAG